MADEKKKVAPSYFTVEEANLICIYNKKDRQVAMEHIYRILPYTPDSDMISIMCSALQKLQQLSDEEFTVEIEDTACHCCYYHKQNSQERGQNRYEAKRKS